MYIPLFLMLFTTYLSLFCRSAFYLVLLRHPSPISCAFSSLSIHCIGPVGISPATDVSVSTKVDKRPGFFGHANLTITWQHPPGDRTGQHIIM